MISLFLKQYWKSQQQIMGMVVVLLNCQSIIKSLMGGITKEFSLKIHPRQSTRRLFTPGINKKGFIGIWFSITTLMSASLKQINYEGSSCALSIWLEFWIINYRRFSPIECSGKSSINFLSTPIFYLWLHPGDRTRTQRNLCWEISLVHETINRRLREAGKFLPEQDEWADTERT